MLRRHDYFLINNPVCYQPVDDLTPEHFQYYDKDGFELNLAERYYYIASHHVLNDMLNHICHQQTWFEVEKTGDLVMDHAVVLHRCRYTDAAQEQLLSLRDSIPQADFLINTKSKWGYDFALDARAEDDTMYEVIHIEYDSRDYHDFQDNLLYTEFDIRHRDWHDAARSIWQHRDQWQHLRGFEQNHWKSRYLMNRDRAEQIEKAI